MPKYWGKQIFSLGRFPEVGQKQKTEREKEREREERKLVITMASYTLQRHLVWCTLSRLGQNTTLHQYKRNAYMCLIADSPNYLVFWQADSYA